MADSCSTAIFAATGQFSRMDLDGDSDIDGMDIAACIAFWSHSDLAADFDGNNVVDSEDIACFSNAIGAHDYLDPQEFLHVYDVGPGRAYSDPSMVPWDRIEPGTLVRIHYREQPYAVKWVIAISGRQDAPIVVRGVPEDGKLPVITGDNAITPQGLDYWNENRSVLKIGGSSHPSQFPEYIRIENLDIQKARPPFTYLDDHGNPGSYASNAAAIHVEMGSHIVIRNCILHDSGNGLFAGSQSSDLLVEGCHIYDNGIEGSIYQHNNYTECQGIVFQYNHFGPLRQGCLGNNLKDRSAGTIIRYNWIEAGNRTIDLVESDSEAILYDPSYHQCFVYGNVLIKHDVEENGQVLHYGGDGGDYSRYRKGTLWFFNNTVVSYRSGNTTLLGLSTNDEHVKCFNNIVYTTVSGEHLAIMGEKGSVECYNNWLKTGWRIVHGTLLGSFTAYGNVVGDQPGFVSLTEKDFGLSSYSTCLNEGTYIPDAILPFHALVYQYRIHQGHVVRSNDGQMDIGAFEFTNLWSWPTQQN